MAQLNSGGDTTIATRDDIVGILGPVDTQKILAILALRPTIADLETALIWLEGDADVFGASAPVKGAAAEIVSILSADEEEEENRAG